MTTSPIARRLADLGVVLPDPPAAVASSVPFVRIGNLVFVSGQLPFENGALAVTGKLGGGLDLEAGIRAARLCAVNLLAQIRAAAGGDQERVRRVVRLGGFVAATPDFTDHPKVMNGASDLIVAVLGEAGRHARTAVGVPSLPLDAACEIEALVELA